MLQSQALEIDEISTARTDLSSTDNSLRNTPREKQAYKDLEKLKLTEANLELNPTLSSREIKLLAKSLYISLSL